MTHHHVTNDVRNEAQAARSGIRPWLFFLVAALFYFYEFFARVAPGVLQKDILEVTGATEGAFGLSMSMYFLAYAPAQLVVGRLLDRFGTRFVVALAAIFVALGCLILASSDSIVTMGIGRFLQELGSAVAYLGVIYLAMVWFPPQRHGIIPGLTVAIGTLGASTAQYPLSVMADSFGWRAPVLTCAIAGFGIAIMLWFLLPRRPSWFIELMREDGYKPDLPVPILTTIMNVAKDRQLWLIALSSAGLYLPPLCHRRSLGRCVLTDRIWTLNQRSKPCYDMCLHRIRCWWRRLRVPCRPPWTQKDSLFGLRHCLDNYCFIDHVRKHPTHMAHRRTAGHVRLHHRRPSTILRDDG